MRIRDALSGEAHFFAKNRIFSDFEHELLLICSEKAVLSMIFGMKIVAMYDPL